MRDRTYLRFPKGYHLGEEGRLPSGTKVTNLKMVIFFKAIREGQTYRKTSGPNADSLREKGPREGALV